MAFKTVQELLNRLADIQTKSIREDMDRRIHALVFSVSMFKELVRLHHAEVKKIAQNSDDPDIKAQLNRIGSRNADKLAKRLKEEFIAIFEKHLDGETSLTYTKVSRGRVDIYIIESTKSGANVFGIIRDRVFNPLRRELVFTSQRGSTKRVLSLIIAGIDVDYDDVDQDTQLGTFAKSKVLEGAPLSEPKKANKAKGIKAGDRLPVAGAGIQLGHFQGPNTVNAIQQRNLIREAQSNVVGLTGLYFEAQRSVEVIHELDAEARFNDAIYSLVHGITGKVDISIVGLESAAGNALSGSKARSKLAELRKFIVKNASTLITGKGSKPVIDMLEDDIIQLFKTGKKSKATRLNRRYKVKRKIKHKANASSVKFSTKTNAFEQVETNAGSIDLQSLIAFLNERLAYYIKQNMGQGGSKKVLNYRTGRFARTSKIQNLYPSSEKGAINADVKYMKDPYQVFEPGQRLHLTGRDPAKIIGRSIRQLLQDEKIANLRRVKVNLRG